MTYLTKLASPMGPLSLASDGDSILGLWLEGQKYFAAGLEAETEERPDLPVFLQAAAWLDGSAFRQRVWKLLLEIPLGETATYGGLTEKLKASGIPASPQAVGGAVGHNPISIIIPCHRVVGADGSLTGYAGGVKKKRFLLELEGVDLSRLYTPKRGTAL